MLSLVSAGTERMLIDFGHANWVDKARQQPDKVKEVVGKIKTDGIAATAGAVRSKLDQPVALGYSNAGVVVEVGEGVQELKAGDRVVSNGAHAELVNVPVNLCAAVPDGVELATAVYTVPGAIALQGIRLAQPTLGEAVVVTGLGLIGQLAVQLLIANGCRVLGIDPDAEKRALAERFGAETAEGGDVLPAADRFSRGRGVDAVIIAAATRSNEPLSQAARMCRQRGRIVLVGVSGLNISRADFYEKELTFQVSCSYGPGRYDPDYEQGGQDYPVGFVRWTERRNFEAVLDIMASGGLDTAALTTHRFGIDRAADAYALLRGEASYLGIVLEYPAGDARALLERKSVASRKTGPEPTRWGRTTPSVAFIGAGNHAGRFLIPAFRNAGARLRRVAASTGVRPAHYAGRFGIEHSGTDVDAAIDDPEVNTVVIATRHDSHAGFVCRALEAGKHVFVEKPLGLTLEEIDRIENLHRARREAGDGTFLMVGFNRRYAPLIVRIKQLLDQQQGVKTFVVTVNAGAVPSAHWTRDPVAGGGRIVGEACHFVDLLRFLAGSPIVDARGRFMKSGGTVQDDVASLEIDFEDGSLGTIHYLANGHKRFPKERIEVFGGGRVLRLDNFNTLRGWGWPGIRLRWAWQQDKGHNDCIGTFVRAIQTGSGHGLIADEELFEVSRVSVQLAARGV